MADWLQVENWRMRKDVERIAELERETASLKSALTDFEKRCAEHEQFRVQHKDCDAMGVENQSLRRALKDCEAKCAQHAAAIEVWQREAQSATANTVLVAKYAGVDMSRYTIEWVNSPPLFDPQELYKVENPWPYVPVGTEFYIHKQKEG